MNEAAYRQLEARATELAAVVDILSAEREQLTAERERLAAEREQYRKLYLQTLERCATLERGIVASKQAERHAVDDSQLALQVLGMLLSAGDQAPAPDLSEETAPDVPERERAPRRPTGRRKLPEHLPRVDIEVLPPEVQQEGLAAFKRIGEEVSEVVERRPESLVVVRLVRPKFVRITEDLDDASPVKIAEPPERPIDRGLAGPGMLADTIVRRWQDHTPLHRQESIYARDGLELSRSTICGWHEQLADLVDRPHFLRQSSTRSRIVLGLKSSRTVSPDSVTSTQNESETSSVNLPRLGISGPTSSAPCSSKFSSSSILEPPRCLVAPRGRARHDAVRRTVTLIPSNMSWQASLFGGALRLDFRPMRPREQAARVRAKVKP